MDYKQMLKRAYSELPPQTFESKRFDIPNLQIYRIGAKSFFHNFKEVCDVLNRDPLQVLKFLAKETATSGTIDKTRAIFQGRFPNETYERLIKRYVNEFVICPICKRPDTKIVKEKRLSFMICEACGAKSSVRAV